LLDAEDDITDENHNSPAQPHSFKIRKKAEIDTLIQNEQRLIEMEESKHSPSSKKFAW
jgi:hypothetical protein